MKKWQILLLAVLAAAGILLATNSWVVWLSACNLFRPTITLDKSESWDGGSYHRLSYGESQSQYIDLYVPDMEEVPPLFVLIHGGGFVNGDSQTRQAQFMYRYFRDHGFACASLNYRLAGEAPFPAAVEDVSAAVNYLASVASDYGFRADKVAIWGESAGGYLAVREAIMEADVNIAALVDYYGAVERIESKKQFGELGIPSWLVSVANTWVSDLCGGYDSCEEYWLRKEYAEYTQEDFDALSILKAADTSQRTGMLKTMICHGDADITVPVLQSELLCDKLKEMYGSENTQYVQFHGYTHADDRFYSDEQLKEIETFLRQVP